MSAESTRNTKMADISSPTSSGLLSHKCCSDLFAKGTVGAIMVIADGNPEKTHNTKHPNQYNTNDGQPQTFPFVSSVEGDFMYVTT